MTISDIVEEVKIEICEEYYKYPHEWDEETEGLTLEDGKCATCPLGRLG